MGASPTTATHLPSGLGVAQLQGAPNGPMTEVRAEVESESQAALGLGLVMAM